MSANTTLAELMAASKCTHAQISRSTIALFKRHKIDLDLTLVQAKQTQKVFAENTWAPDDEVAWPGMASDTDDHFGASSAGCASDRVSQKEVLIQDDVWSVRLPEAIAELFNVDHALAIWALKNFTADVILAIRALADKRFVPQMLETMQGEQSRVHVEERVT